MMWRDVAFAHWRCAPERLSSTLPNGVTLDTCDGSAWISVVPFRMTGVHPRGLPVFPGFDRVAEINLRTYVSYGGRRGVWFYSLDAASPLAVRAARVTTGLPYFDARIVTSTQAATIAYASERIHRGQPRAAFAASYVPQPSARADERDALDTFLHERYHFFAERGGRIVRGDIEHAPWELQPLEMSITRNTLADDLGLSLDRPPDRLRFSVGMRVRAST